MTPLVLTAIAAGLGLAGSGAKSLIGRKAAKENRSEAERLQAELKKNDFGFTEAQKNAMRREQLDPLRAGLTSQRSASEAALATRGGAVSGADISRLRTEQQRSLAGGAERATANINAANIAESARLRDQARQELFARKQADAQRKSEISGSIINALTGASMAGGQLAASNNITQNQAQAARAAAQQGATQPNYLSILGGF